MFLPAPNPSLRGFGVRDLSFAKVRLEWVLNSAYGGFSTTYVNETYSRYIWDTTLGSGAEHGLSYEDRTSSKVPVFLFLRTLSHWKHRPFIAMYTPGGSVCTNASALPRLNRPSELPNL